MTLKISSNLAFDVVMGSSADLIAAGLVTANQMPGFPCNGNTMCTFSDGERVAKGSSAGKISTTSWESYRQIIRTGKDRFRVTVGLPLAEVQRRRAEYEQQREKELASAVVAVVSSGASSHWAGRVGLDFAAKVIRRQHLRIV